MNTFACAAVALGAGALSLGWAAWHPIWPMGLLALALATAALCAWRPVWGVWLLAAALPWVNQTVHTGWLMLEEFDVLLLAVASGSWASQCLRPQPLAQRALGLSGFLLLLAALGWAGAWSQGGLAALPWQAAHAFADYQSPWNAWRASKPLLWAALLLPLWAGAGDAEARQRVGRAWWGGGVISLAVVCALVLLERLLYAELLEVHSGYRTTAWFWEMHVGGGAIDVYLALSLPLAAWWLMRARSRLVWWCAALLLVCACHTVLTTQSRGLYVAAVLGVLVARWLYRHQPGGAGPSRTPRFGPALLAAALFAQLAWALLGSSAITQRLAQSGQDWAQRVQHWRSVASALDSASDLALGIGAGRLPAHMAARPGGGVPGRLLWTAAPEGGLHMRLEGPSHEGLNGVRFAAVQRLGDFEPGAYRVRLRYQAQPGLRLLVSVCERHLIYDRRCQWRFLRHPPDGADGGAGQRVVRDVSLSGDSLAGHAPLAGWHEGFFSVSVLTSGLSTTFDRIELFDSQGRSLLFNSDFSAGAARWLPAAQAHFEPWHADNLYLELLVERGLPVLLAVLALWAWALFGGWRAVKAGDPNAGAWLASLCALGALGCLISLGEFPRLAWWWWVSLGLCAAFDGISSRKRVM